MSPVGRLNGALSFEDLDSPCQIAQSMGEMRPFGSGGLFWAVDCKVLLSYFKRCPLGIGRSNSETHAFGDGESQSQDHDARDLHWRSYKNRPGRTLGTQVDYPSTQALDGTAPEK
jgi:hypothetical protein